jgi:hypothetical protein
MSCLLVLIQLQSGCVRRRMTIRSNPPGAAVWIDNQQIGTTPVSTSFVYYGTRKIQLVKDGFETMTVYRRIRPPWYQVPPLDFVSENLWPSELRDERVLAFELRVQPPVSLEETYREAEEFRRSVRQDAAVALLEGNGSRAPLQAEQKRGTVFDVAAPLRRLPHASEHSAWSRQAQLDDQPTAR